MSFWSAVGNIAAGAGKAAISGAASGYASSMAPSSSQGLGGLGSMPGQSQAFKWNSKESTDVERGKTKRAQSIGETAQGEGLWNNDPVSFTNEWIERLNDTDA